MQRTIKYAIWPRDLCFEEGLQSLVNFIGERGFVIGSNQKMCLCSIAISKFDTLKFHSIDEFIKIMKRTPAYESFSCILLSDRNGEEGCLTITISVGRGPVEISVDSGNVDLVEGTHAFLKSTFRLKNPEIPKFTDERAKYLQPSIFIAHRFDSKGEKYFETVSTFLVLLGFDVQHGKNYTSQAIPDKVRTLIDSQDILLAIISGNEEAPWLIAEPNYALGREKHVVLAVENGANYDATILGKDLEQIRFEPGHIEQSFIHLLREFRSVRVKGL